MTRLSLPRDLERLLAVLGEFAERAPLCRGIERKQGGFTVRVLVSDGDRTQRRYRGAESPWAKLTAAQVAEIRASSETHVAWARRLGVCPRTIRSARSGETYQ